MISKFNKILIILILVFVSICAVSAADTTNETINITVISATDISGNALRHKVNGN